MKTVVKYEAELDRLKIIDRWGECRRFHSDRRKIERRNWLIDKISTINNNATKERVTK